MIKLDEAVWAIRIKGLKDFLKIQEATKKKVQIETKGGKKALAASKKRTGEAKKQTKEIKKQASLFKRIGGGLKRGLRRGERAVTLTKAAVAGGLIGAIVSLQRSFLQRRVEASKTAIAFNTLRNAIIMSSKRTQNLSKSFSAYGMGQGKALALAVRTSIGNVSGGTSALLNRFNAQEIAAIASQNFEGLGFLNSQKAIALSRQVRALSSTEHGRLSGLADRPLQELLRTVLQKRGEGRISGRAKATLAAVDTDRIESARDTINRGAKEEYLKSINNAIGAGRKVAKTLEDCLRSCQHGYRLLSWTLMTRYRRVWQNI